MFRLISLVIGYFIGCIQFAYFFGKISKNIDIREFGSGNSGATNAIRVLGSKAGIVIFALDILKGIFAYVLCSIIFKGIGTFYKGAGIFGTLPGMYAGIGVVLGHNFPFYLKFKGGKGSASGIGLILATDIKISIISFFMGVICVVFTKYISLASMIVSFMFFACTIFFKYPLEAILISLCVTLLSIFQHRSNIKRIVDGTERKFLERKN